MNIENLVKAFATYFREDEDIIRQIIVDNVTLDDMGLDEPTEEQIEQWSYRFEDELGNEWEFELDDELQDMSDALDADRDLTDEELREEVEKLRNTPNWMDDDAAVQKMEGLARKVFEGLDVNEQTMALLDMVLNLCDEIDKLKNQKGE